MSKTTPCKICGKPAEGRKIYCGRPCYAIGRRRPTKKVCEWCNETFELPRARAKGRRFCCRKCTTAYLNVEITKVCASCNVEYKGKRLGVQKYCTPCRKKRDAYVPNSKLETLICPDCRKRRYATKQGVSNISRCRPCADRKRRKRVIKPKKPIVKKVAIKPKKTVVKQPIENTVEKVVTPHEKKILTKDEKTKLKIKNLFDMVKKRHKK